MAAPLHTYTVTEFEASPGPALRHAREGETVEITSRGRPVLSLVLINNEDEGPTSSLEPAFGMFRYQGSLSNEVTDQAIAQGARRE